MVTKYFSLFSMLCFAALVVSSADSARAGLIINEILSDPSGTPDGLNIDANGDGAASGSQDEFVEMVNDSATPLDISSWTLDDLAADAVPRHIFPAGTVLAPGQAILVFGGGTLPFPDVHGGAIVQVANVDPPGILGLNNGGDAVVIRDDTAALVTFLEYGPDEGLDGNSGQSITRNPDITGSFVLHHAFNGIAASPGFHNDGVTPFGIPEPSTMAMALMALVATICRPKR